MMKKDNQQNTIYKLNYNLKYKIKKFLTISVLAITPVIFQSCAAWPGGLGILASLLQKAADDSMLFFLPPSVGKKGNAVLESITVTPINNSIAKGTDLQMIATGIYSDGSSADISSGVTWTSSDPTRVVVSSTGLASSAAALGTGTSIITAEYNLISGSTNLTVTAAVLVSIGVEAPSLSIANGFDYRYKAIGFFSDGTTQDLTKDASIDWNTSDAGIATVNTDGLLTTVSSGSTSISAQFPAGGTYTITGTSSVNVTAETLVGFKVLPENPEILVETQKQFTAKGTFSDSSTLDLTTFSEWTSSSPGTAAIAAATGLATAGASPGTTTIRADYPTNPSVNNDSTVLTVKSCTMTGITISPASANVIAIGTKQQFIATANFSDCPDQDVTKENNLTWLSSIPATATIDSGAGSATKGQATSVAAGSTVITARYAQGGTTCGVDAVCATANLEVRVISLLSITISPLNPSAAHSDGNPGVQQFSATGHYSDLTTQDLTSQVVWSSSDPSVATISNAQGTQGRALTAATGTSVISAKRDGITGTTGITVVSDTTRPSLSKATRISETQIRVKFSEPMDVNKASLASNYIITDSPQGSCAGGDNFTGSAQTGDFSILTVKIIASDEYELVIGTGIQYKTYTVVANLAANALEDLAGNDLICPNSDTFVGVDLKAPEVSAAASLDPFTIRVTFTEDVNATEAKNTANYKIVNAPASGSCGAGTNFSGSTQTSDFALSSISGSGAVYDITLDATQITGKSYTVIASNAIHDLASTPNAMGCPNSADFTGLEQLKVSTAYCVADLKNVIVSFSKSVISISDTAGSANCSSTTECAKRYKLTGVSDLGAINSVVPLNGTVCGGAPADGTGTKFCVTHTNNQTGGAYTLIAANNADGDGFDNTSWGSIRNSGNTENVQASPKDRASFVGCATSPKNFVDGPIADDPFGDSSDFGYLAGYAGKIYVGPNAKGTLANRFNPDGSSPQNITFEFIKDTSTANSTGTHSNTAATRDGGIAVPPFVSIGFTGCSLNTANLATACGPDNEDGRGLFASGSIGGTEYLFITGGRSQGDNDYLYYTSDTDTLMNFNYIDAQATWDIVSGNKGTESLKIFNNKVYWMSPGDRSYRPYLAEFRTLNAQSSAGTDSDFMHMRFVTGFGYSGTESNFADKVGGTLYGFNDRMYAANNGSITDSTTDCPVNASYSASPVCKQLGGIIRTRTNSPTPCTAAPCTGATEWVDISPRANAKYYQYFSAVLTTLSDMIPADRPIPAMADFNGRLFLIRNACTTNTNNPVDRANGPTGDDDVNCPSGNEVPQLWKCDPASGASSDTHCDADEWTLVAENGSTGKSNMGDGNNKKITLLIKNGSYLYVGYDNAVTGIEIWRTNIANPSLVSDFSQIGGDGLTGPSENHQIYSSISGTDSGVSYVYVSTGKNGVPVKIYRQQN